MTSSKPYLIRAIYEWIVDNNLTPHIAADTNTPGTIVPKTYIQDGHIVLDISEAATSNLIISNDSLEFKARLGGVSHNIYIPISAIMLIYAQENDQGMEFPPEEFEEEDTTMLQKSKPKLTLITSGKNDEEE